ncbi:hypothetical protein D6779_07100 [Candidatus Parcubacteria bacterium]|nr:MAG: hypothetical protein D6779_07100 [Candidatus Parcubacteria bacterium]
MMRRSPVALGLLMLWCAAFVVGCTSVDEEPSSLPRDGMAVTVPAALPTWTPLPALSVEEAKKQVATLLRTNAGCELPCWWGFTPGETRWETAKHFIDSFASVVNVAEYEGLQYADVIVPVPEEISPVYLRQNYVVRDGVIERIYIPTTGHVEAYRLSNFLSAYGPPAEIGVRTYSTHYRQELPFEVALFYPERGILAMYFDMRAGVEDEQVIGCIQEQNSAFLGLWSPEDEMTFVDALKVFSWFDEQWQFLPLEEVTDMDVATFYETYLDPAAEVCVRTPQALWPPQ